MKTIAFAATALLVIGTVNAAGDGVTYKYQGNDWTGTCGNGTFQSPIDIPASAIPFLNSTQTFKRFLASVGGQAKIVDEPKRDLQVTTFTPISSTCTYSTT
jgi:hypothetical protein